MKRNIRNGEGAGMKLLHHAYSANGASVPLGARHPVLFQVLLLVAAFVLTLVFSLCARMMCSGEAGGQYVHTAIGRLLAGCFLFLVFIRCFDFKKQFSGFVIMLPVLLFAAWNVVLHFATGGVRAENHAYALMLGLAPAVFEEVLFRGVFIHNLKANGRSPMAMLLISAIFFGIVHMTNIVGAQHIVNVIVQAGYAIVIGLVFSAIYIKTGDLLSVVIAHAVIDITSNMFPSGQVTVFPWGIALIVLLAVETWYAFHLMPGNHTPLVEVEE